MSPRPLDHPRLAAIARKLDQRQLEEAQHLLAQLGDVAAFRHAITFLTTRLLLLRGLLTNAQVVERLEQLLLEAGDFPEALDLIEAVRGGQLDGSGAPSARGSRPPPSGPLQQDGLRPGELRGAFGHPVSEPVAPTNLRRPDIPQAGRVPAVAAQVKSAGPDRPPSIPDLDVPGGAARAPGFNVELQPQPLEPAATETPPTRRSRPPERSLPYSAESIREEVVLKPRRPSAPPPAPAREIDAEPARAGSARPPESRKGPTPPIVSGAPPPLETSVVTLFDVAKLLDGGRLGEALEALDQLESTEPEHVLMRARVLSRAGRPDEARQCLERLAQAPLLEPEVRAGVSRLALEMGDPELAYAQAERAHADDAGQPMVCLSLAWAAVRWLRRTGDPRAFRTAKRALAPLASRGGPHASLLLALRACVAAHGGQPEEAESLARDALDIEPTADALAALAMAAAALGRVDELKQACARLRELDPLEADALASSLAAKGNQFFDLARSVPPREAVPDIPAQIWGPLELALVGDAPAEAWARFAQLADDTLAQVTSAARREGPALAAVAASFMTVAPVSRDFAPFDETPWSLHRVAALLSLLAGAARGARPEQGRPVVSLVGAYVGEVLRQAHGLKWRGSLADATAELGGNEGYAPFEVVREHLSGGAPLAVEQLMARAPERAWRAEPRPIAVEPPCPWDPAAWPAPARLPALAAALSHSVISHHCSRASTGLDGTLASLAALDAYLDLLAPTGAPRPADERWARRASVLVGAYAGQVLCDAGGADWLDADSTTLGPESYGVQLARGRIARPVRHVLTRLVAGGPRLVEWANDWLDGEPR